MQIFTRNKVFYWTVVSTEWLFQFNENSIETQLRITVGSK